MRSVSSYASRPTYTIQPRTHTHTHTHTHAHRWAHASVKQNQRLRVLGKKLTVLNRTVPKGWTGREGDLCQTELNTAA